MMRVGLFKPVHVKTLVAQEQRMLLTSRKLLDVESDLRGTLRKLCAGEYRKQNEGRRILRRLTSIEDGSRSSALTCMQRQSRTTRDALTIGVRTTL